MTCAKQITLCFIIAAALGLFRPASLYAGNEINSKDLYTRYASATGNEKISISIELMDFYRYKEPKKSLEIANESLKLLVHFPNPKQKVEILNQLIVIYTVLGNTPTARKYGLESLTLASKFNFPNGKSMALTQLANIEASVGNYSKALKYIDQAKPIVEANNDTLGFGHLYNTLARVYLYLNDYSHALESALKAEGYFLKVNNPLWIANVTNNIGIIYYELKRYDKSIEYYEKAMKCHEAMNNEALVGSAFNNIGLIYSKENKYALALKYLEKSVAISKKIGRMREMADTYNYMGELYFKMKDYTRASTYFKMTLEIKETTNDPKLTSTVLMNWGKVMHATKKYNEAFLYIRKSLAVSVPKGLKEEMRDAYLELSEIYKSKNNYAEAFKFYKKHKAINDELFSKNNADKIEQIQFHYQLEKKEREVDLLKKNNDIRQLTLAKKSDQIRLYVFIFFWALVLLFIIYMRYLLKSRTNKTLESEIEGHKRTALKLRESEAKFRDLAEKSVLGIVIIQDGLIQYVNPRFLSFFGYGETEIIGHDISGWVFKDDIPLVNTNIKRRLAGEMEGQSYEFRGVKRNGEIVHFECHGAATRYFDQPAVIETIVEITERKTIEAELMQTKKIEAIGILVGGIANDFYHLLGIILGNLSMLIEELEQGAEEKADEYTLSMLRSAKTATIQAEELSQKLLVLSEGGWLVPGKVFLNNLLQRTLDYFPKLKPFPITVNIPQDLNPVLGDERYLRQVLVNLFQNVEESMVEPGEVKIDAENIMLSDDNPYSLAYGDYVKISIRDSGKGIPAPAMEKIFDPYFSTKDAVTQKGRGLGLPICYSIIKKHNGYISVESEVGIGTTVTLILPICY